MRRRGAVARRLLGLSIGLIASLLVPAAASAIDEFPLPAGTQPGGIVTGPDGALWFTEEGANGIGRITTSGAYTHYGPLQLAAAFPDQVTVGPDGRLWFTMANASRIGALNPATGAIDEYSTNVGGGPQGITAANGALWYTSASTNSIRQIDVAGNVGAIIPIPTGTSDPSDITVGPDGRLWFTEQATDKIGAVAPAAGATVQEFDLTPDPATPPVQPSGIISTGGALWFTESSAGAIGRITTGGAVSHFPGAGTDPSAIAAGRDGALWYTLGVGATTPGSCTGPGENSIGRITTGGTFTNKFPTPTPLSDPSDITEGPDGQLWFSEHCASKIGRIATGAIVPPPPPPPPVAVLSVSSLRVSPSSFKSAPKGRSISAKKKKKKPGARVTYRISRAASTKFTVQRVETGRKKGKKCVKAKGKKKGKKCTRYVLVRGSFTHKGKGGSNKFRFSGRVGGKRLKAGKYRLNAVARAGTTKSKVKRANFKIVR